MMQLKIAFWSLLSFCLCSRRVNGLQLSAGDLSAPPCMPPLPNCAALRKMVGQSRATVAGKVEGLLRKAASKTGVTNISGESARSRPLVVTLCRPFERFWMRRLLECSQTSVSEVEEFESDSSETSKSRGSLDDWWKLDWRDLCSAAGVGLDVLMSGAYLLTLELPSFGCTFNQSGITPNKILLANEENAPNIAEGSSVEAPVGVSVKEGTNGTTEQPNRVANSLSCATEAAVIAALAVPLVETADVLLLPLLYHEVAATRGGSRRLSSTQFGEFLCLETFKGSVADGRSEPFASDSGALGSDDTSRTYGFQPSQQAAAATAGQIRLPEDVVQLLRAMKLLTQQRALKETTGDTLAAVSVNPHIPTELRPRQLPRSRRLPRIVVLLGENVPPELQLAIRAEVCRHVGTPNAQVSVFSMQLPEGEAETRDRLGHLINETRCRSLSAAQLAGSLAAFLTGSFNLGSPSSVEFPSRAIASSVCAPPARRALVAARERLLGLENLHLKRSSTQSFGIMAQRLISEALQYYDSQTRRFQLSPDRRVFREELQRSLERDLRSLYLRDALRIEACAKARLRQTLVTALQKDARRFGAAAQEILTEVVATVERQLVSLLPPAAILVARALRDPFLGSNLVPARMLENMRTSKALTAAAMATRDTWLSYSFSTSLLELHLLLLRRFTRSFSHLAMELSRSPLASLLRQQHSRQWMGISLRPSFSLTTLLRTRGDGNLQGYSSYRTGALNILFGFTNDGDGLERGQQVALRLQPKLHIDVEVS